MALAELKTLLERSFQPAAAADLDAVIRLAVGADELLLEVRHGTLGFAPVAEPDATFFFADEATARQLLTGRADPFEAFMRGAFRADGHLLWAFTLMAMFASRGLPETPSG